MIKKISLVLLMLICFSCATATRAGYVKMVESWRGADINKLISYWGPPGSTYTMPNKNTVYTFYNGSCTTMMTANQNNIIVRMQFRGYCVKKIAK